MDLAETQWVLGISTRRAFCLVAHTRRGVGGSVACTLDCVGSRTSET